MFAVLAKVRSQNRHQGLLVNLQHVRCLPTAAEKYLFVLQCACSNARAPVRKVMLKLVLMSSPACEVCCLCSMVATRLHREGREGVGSVVQRLNLYARLSFSWLRKTRKIRTSHGLLQVEEECKPSKPILRLSARDATSQAQWPQSCHERR